MDTYNERCSVKAMGGNLPYRRRAVAALYAAPPKKTEEVRAVIKRISVLKWNELHESFACAVC